MFHAHLEIIFKSRQTKRFKVDRQEILKVDKPNKNLHEVA